MRTSRNRPQRKAQTLGFSLFELLVVIVIIGIIASAAMLTAGDFGVGHRNESAINQFKNVLITAQTQALAGNTFFSIEVTNEGYQVYQGELQNNTVIRWHPWQQQLGLHRWPGHAKINLRSGGDNTENLNHADNNRIIIDNSGNIYPFQLVVSFDMKSHYQIQGLDDGQVLIHKQENL